MSLRGTQGPDLLQNGPGYFYSNLVEGFGGDDTLIAYTRQDTLEGGQGNDLLENGVASYEQASGGVHAVFTDTAPQDIGADQGVDTFSGIVGLIGSAYGDTLSAGANDAFGRNVQISSGYGDDSLIGGASFDTLSGGGGDDTIDASASIGAMASGGEGNDLILLKAHSSGSAYGFGGAGDDQIYNAVQGAGDDGADTITGARNWAGGGGSELWGGGGDDSLVGTEISDRIDGGSGHNTINGAGGGDLIYVLSHAGPSGQDPDASEAALYRRDVVIESGAGNTLSFYNGPDGAYYGGPDGVRATVDLRTGAAHVDRLTASGPQALADVTFNASVDAVTGSSGADTLQGGALDCVLFGDDGADSIVGGDAYSRVNGNKGDDIILGHSQVGDWLLGGQGNDSIDATTSSGHNIINGNLGADTLKGGSGGDTLRGGQGDDLIVGGARGDWISGDMGHDILTGGGGADVFHIAANNTTTIITDFNYADGDRIQLDAGSTYAVSASGADTVIILDRGAQITLSHVSATALPAGAFLIG
jgi:Ca2+-binding RTX toxin-like protein